VKSRIRDRIRDIRSSQGSALIEFTFIGIALLIPLAYIVLTVFHVQNATYAVTSASREAGRAFVKSNSNDLAADRAYLAAQLALENHGLEFNRDDLLLSCTRDPCLTPGGEIAVFLKTNVKLPLLPGFLASHAPTSVTVSADHREQVDEWR
jgi:hypothetical protein